MILGETGGPAIWYVRLFDASLRRGDAAGFAIGSVPLSLCILPTHDSATGNGPYFADFTFGSFTGSARKRSLPCFLRSNSNTYERSFRELPLA
jgi:hypothetical protein